MSTGTRRVAVAISGGVDSSVAAAILKRDGYEVMGVTMTLGPESADVTEAAERVCRALDIPLAVVDLSGEFEAQVIDHFTTEYLKGRTPNPCVVCNQKMKFGYLLDRALALGADAMATGHYARIEQRNGEYRLLRAVDATKDQSYILYTLGQSSLQHLILPMGVHRKTEARHMAEQMGLPFWDRPESQEICFIPGNNYRQFLARYAPPQPGEMVDTAGKVLGRHSGIACYTVGQRRGLGLASRHRLYVVSIDAESNRLVVGTKAELLSAELLAGDVTYVRGEPPEGPVPITAKIRYKAPAAKATLYPRGRTAWVRFEQPQRAITPGQSVVFYSGDEVLGGGTIE